jgi:hypothetical protein
LASTLVLVRLDSEWFGQLPSRFEQVTGYVPAWLNGAEAGTSILIDLFSNFQLESGESWSTQRV